jgi:hypothetical protein
MFESDGLLSASPLNSSRRPTATTEGHGHPIHPHPQYTPFNQVPYGLPSSVLASVPPHTPHTPYTPYSDRDKDKDREGTSYLIGRGSISMERGSLDGSLEGGVPNSDPYPRNSRVDSPEPALPADRSEDNPFQSKGSQNGH